MKTLFILSLLLTSISSYAHPHCKIKYSVEILESENHHQDFYECSMGMDVTKTTQTRSKKFVANSFKECQEIADTLIGQRTEVQVLVMMMDYGDPIMATCKGTIKKIKKVKFKK